MKLDDNDYREIASRIEEGRNSIEYEKGGDTLFIDYTFETTGYIEDDFECGWMNGTGAWVETSRSLCINNAISTDVNGFDEKVHVDENLLKKYIA